ESRGGPHLPLPRASARRERRLPEGVVSRSNLAGVSKRSAAERPRASRAASQTVAVRRSVFITVDEALKRIRAGKMVVVVDDAKRENEGDVVFAAEKATPEMVNFAVKHGRGILCAPMAPAIADRLGLRMMVSENSSRFGTPFTESVD